MDIIKPILLCLLSLLMVAAHAGDHHSSFTSKQRNLFLDAKKALHINQLQRFHALRQQLGNYPLAPYLDYLYLRHHLNQVPATQVDQFLTDYDNTFFSKRLRNVWLDRLAANKQWHHYLRVYRQPQTANRQCLRLQALLASGQRKQAMAETPSLWMVSHSQKKSCDPAFKIWQQRGLLTQKMRWQRMLLALQHRQFSLARHLAKALNNRALAEQWIGLWEAMHRSPASLLKQLPRHPPAGKQASLARDQPLSRQIILHGINRLSRYTPALAFASWQRIEPAYKFTKQDKIDVRRHIGKRAALSRDDQALRYFGNTPAEPWRVRAALWVENWPAVNRAILSLNADQKKLPQWQYWLARSQEKIGRHEAATQTLIPLSRQRDYYGFLAADVLAQPYKMNHQPIQVKAREMAKLKQLPAVQRLHEFYVLNMHLEAHREAHQLQQSLTVNQLKLLAVLTHKWGWHNQTISLLGRARYWDALNLRFPVLFDDALRHAGKSNSLDPSWLFAITRQESAFNITARSHAGALGLMQLMPKTGHLIAKLIHRPLHRTTELLNPNTNIELGSAYLKWMYDQNQHNPVLATAAYNAGPKNISRWLPPQTLSADIWVENIPFNETRRYVRRVLSYAAIFDHQRNNPVTPLSKRMPAILPQSP